MCKILLRKTPFIFLQKSLHMNNVWVIYTQILKINAYLMPIGQVSCQYLPAESHYLSPYAQFIIFRCFLLFRWVWPYFSLKTNKNRSIGFCRKYWLRRSDWGQGFRVVNKHSNWIIVSTNLKKYGRQTTLELVLL